MRTERIFRTWTRSFGSTQGARTSIFALPFLAGLAEDELAGADPFQRFDEEALRRALGFYLISRLPTKCHPIPRLFSHWEDARPRWFLQALQNHPQTVADAFTAVHSARVRAKDLPDQHLYDMATNPEYERVARFSQCRRCSVRSQAFARSPR